MVYILILQFLKNASSALHTEMVGFESSTHAESGRTCFDFLSDFNKIER